MPVKDRQVIPAEAGLPGSMPSEAMPADRTQRRAAVGGSPKPDEPWIGNPGGIRHSCRWRAVGSGLIRPDEEDGPPFRMTDGCEVEGRPLRSGRI